MTETSAAKLAKLKPKMRSIFNEMVALVRENEEKSQTFTIDDLWERETVRKLTKSNKDEEEPVLLKRARLNLTSKVAHIKKTGVIIRINEYNHNDKAIYQINIPLEEIPSL